MAGVISMNAQNLLRGVVVSASDQEPIIGASVIEKGTINATVTDADGSFSIDVKKNATLIISYIGFETQEVSATGKQNLKVKMVEDAKLLDDVVVVGYGTMKKKDLTGSVSSANLKAFEKSANINIAQSLQGTVPGLNIGQSSSAGSDPTIKVRGANTISGNSSVLIVLDGIIYTGSLTSLNPADIQSIDVLKDASATAVYGAQAANGVLLITSKKGAKGKAKISYSGSYSFQSPTHSLHTMNRDEMLRFDTEALWQYSKTQESGYTQPNSAFDLTSRMPDAWMVENGKIIDGDYNWWDDFTRNGSILENKLTISGGSDNMSYLISGANTKQKNFMLNDDYSRNTLRVNLDIQPTKWLKAGVQAFGSFENRDGQETYLPFLVECNPLTQPYDKDGNMNHYPAHDARENPFHGSLVSDYDRTNSFFANLYAEVQLPLKGLTYRINYGNNYRESHHNYASEFAENSNGQAYKHANTYYDYTVDNIVNYNNDFGKHTVGATFVYGASRRKYDSTDADAKLFPRMTLGYNSLQLGSTQTTSSGAWLETLLYQMYRVNYSYDSRYLATLTLRRDGFSGFASDHKSATFPSVALGWVISNEKWYKVPVLEYLKLRAGWGVSGNQTSRYSSLARVSSSIGYTFGDGVSNGSMRQELISMENSDLKWEKTSGFNFGLDFSLLKGRINGNMEFYTTKTKDLLYAVSIPSITGFTSIMSNVGEIANKGFELTVSSRNIVRKDFEWSSTFNFSTNSNKINKLAGLDTNGDGQEDDLTSSSLFIGESLSAIYDYETDGIYQIGDDIPSGFNPGNYRIVDYNGDGQINEKDRHVIGKADPSCRMGLLNSFRYKDFTLSFFLNAVLGGSKSFMGRNSYAELVNDNTLRHNRYTEQVDNFWTPSNPGGIFALYNAGPAYEGHRYENRSFLRLQDVTLSYNLPKPIMKKIGIEGINVYMSCKNLLTITGWHGWDPEADMIYQDVNGQNRVTGSRYENRPVMKSVTFGINVNL